ncbi:MAG: DinB family protein [Cyclobacteriaceae bacterium]|nr:DinB family protein [Cyclobacteriaceae bacterium]
MKRLLCIFCFLPLVAFPQEESTVQKEFMGVMGYNSGQIVSLAEEIPAELYDWRPAEGVRSVGEAILHTASANYFFGTMLGATIPEGIDPMSMEKSITGKENVIAALKESYAFIMEVGKNLPSENFLDEVTFPTGDKFNKRTCMMIIIAHAWEHTGQLIAYARSNNVVPPWSKPPSEVSEGE